MKFLSKLLAFAVIISLFSCEKDNEINKEEQPVKIDVAKGVTITNGMLAFESAQVFKKQLELNENENGIDIEKNYPDFVSIESEFEKLADDFSNIESSEEYLKAKSKYDTRFEFGESIEYFYMPLNWRPFVNRDNTMQIGNWLYKFYPDRYVIVLNATPSKLAKAESLSESDPSGEIVVVRADNLKKSKNWGLLTEDSKKKGSKKLRVRLIAHKIFLPIGTTGNVAESGHEIFLECIQEYKTWVGTYPSSTTFWIRNLKYTFGSTTKTSPTYETGKGSRYKRILSRDNKGLIMRPSFRDFKVEVKSGGVPVWCTLSYSDY